MTAEQFFEAYQKYLEEEALLPHCTGEGAEDWDCCDKHRDHGKEHYRLRGIAEGFELHSEDTPLLSPRWWNKLAAQNNLKLPNRVPFKAPPW